MITEGKMQYLYDETGRRYLDVSLLHASFNFTLNFFACVSESCLTTKTICTCSDCCQHHFDTCKTANSMLQYMHALPLQKSARIPGVCWHCHCQCWSLPSKGGRSSGQAESPVATYDQHLPQQRDCRICSRVDIHSPWKPKRKLSYASPVPKWSAGMHQT